MIDHVTLWVKNIDESKEFYHTALAPLGYKLLENNSTPKWIGFGQEDTEGGRDFWLKEGVVSGKAISCFAFTAKSKKQVDDFYHAAIEAGGKDNGPPGYRPEYSTYYSGYYAAFILDPNGYNIEAVWNDLEKGKSQKSS
jgi:catechol 2,3-dioxygenase-like lactoylglutathione lyase family enzyme